MTKKDYKAIAEVVEKYAIGSEAEGEAILRVSEFVKVLSSVLGADNPRFDAERFRAACYGEPFKK